VSRSRERVCLGAGLKLDINRLLRDGTMPRAMGGRGSEKNAASSMRRTDGITPPDAPMALWIGCVASRKSTAIMDHDCAGAPDVATTGTSRRFSTHVKKSSSLSDTPGVEA
jgi:hypothetical protein